jgi:hypothetical protein
MWVEQPWGHTTAAAGHPCRGMSPSFLPYGSSGGFQVDPGEHKVRPYILHSSFFILHKVSGSSNHGDTPLLTRDILAEECPQVSSLTGPHYYHRYTAGLPL